MLTGIRVGIGCYIGVYAKGYSCLTNYPTRRSSDGLRRRAAQHSVAGAEVFETSRGLPRSTARSARSARS